MGMRQITLSFNEEINYRNGVDSTSYYETIIPGDLSLDEVMEAVNEFLIKVGYDTIKENE